MQQQGGGENGAEEFSGQSAATLPPHDPKNSSVPFFALALLAFLIGAFLRLWQLGDQILLDDEWHALHKLLHADARDIATHLGLADYSIPLTLYYRFLYLHGGLSEWGMRLPMLAAGIGLVALAPRLLRRCATPPALAVWTGLLAISPFMIYHSRTARPYALTTLLVFVALIAFWKWWRGEGNRAAWAALYVLCTFLAGWLHLITLPFTLLPFAICGIEALSGLMVTAKAAPIGAAASRVRGAAGAAGWRRVGALLLLGVLTSLPLLAALLPPLLNDFAALAGKSGGDSVALDTLYRGALLAFGTANPIVFAVLLLLLLAGLAAWWRRDAAFVAYIMTILIGSATAIALAHPAWIQHPGTYARYLQPAIPFLLLFVAEGFVSLSTRLPVAAQALAAAIALAALFGAGPIPGYAYAPNQFMGHPYFQFDYDAAHNPYRTQLPDGPIPDFYRRLAAQPPRTLTLIEAPWSLETNHDPQPLYQRVHRQYVRIGLTSPLCGLRDYGDYPPGDAGMRLAQFVHLNALLQGDAAGADFLVMHLHPWPSNLPPAPQWPDVATCLPQLEQHFGAPAYRDDELEVFALSPAARATPH